MSFLSSLPKMLNVCFSFGANCVELNVEGGGALGMGVAGRVASDRSGRKDSRAEAGPRTSSLPASLPASHHSRQHIESRSPMWCHIWMTLIAELCPTKAQDGCPNLKLMRRVGRMHHLYHPPTVQVYWESTVKFAFHEIKLIIIQGDRFQICSVKLPNLPSDAPGSSVEAFTLSAVTPGRSGRSTFLRK